MTETGSADVNGSIVQLPTVVNYPTPPIPPPSPPPAVSFTSLGTAAATCTALGLTAGTNCNVSGSNIIINNTSGTPLSLPSISLGAHINLVLTATSAPAQYNLNSISLSGGSEIKVSATAPTQAVLVNIVGKNPDNTDIAMPVDMVGGTFAAVEGCATCSAFDASMLQFVYGGTGEIRMTGNSGAATTIYAPDAEFNLQGTADLYRIGGGLDGQHSWNGQRPLRPPAVEGFLRRGPPDGRHLQLEALLAAL